MSRRKRKRHSSDSFLVDITPPDKDDRFPAIFIYRRKKVRTPGSIALKKPPIHIDGPWEGMSERAYAKLAKTIGEAILGESPNIQRWLKTR